jgi:maleamate amidohydrolase
VNFKKKNEARLTIFDADGMQNGFRVIVPRECVGDRQKSIHESNLFDMNAKNADVVSKADVMAHLKKIEAQD